MAVYLAPGSFGAGYQAFDTNGKPLNGGFIYTYAAGTTSLQSTYTTSAGTVANANPIVLGTDGRPQSSGNIVEIWLTSGTAYKFTLTDSLNNQIAVYDNLTGTNDIAAVTEWIPAGTPTFVSATQFTVTGNQTSVLDVGRRIKAVVTAGTIYGTISASTFSTVTTLTVDWDSTQLDSGLSAVSYGILDAANISIPTTRMDGTTETITAAATIDLGAIRSRSITVSGSTAITRLSIPDGQIRFFTFSGSPNLSNTVSQILLAPSGSTITTVTNSVAVFRGEPGVARMILYFPPGAAKKPTTTVLTSGSGTYTPPSTSTRIEVELIGGGGGGAAATTNSGTTGNNTTFDTLTGSGGVGGNTNSGGVSAGGAATNGDVNIPGGGGSGGPPSGTNPGGGGGDGFFGGAGGAPGANQPGQAAATNSGAGASGGGGNGTTSGGGGASGGYVRKLYTTVSSSFSYSVGATAAGGSAGGQSGGTGAAGIIIIKESYD